MPLPSSCIVLWESGDFDAGPCVTLSLDLPLSRVYLPGPAASSKVVDFEHRLRSRDSFLIASLLPPLHLPLPLPLPRSSLPPACRALGARASAGAASRRAAGGRGWRWGERATAAYNFRLGSSRGTGGVH
jgi:hypothetical protein